MSDTHPSHEYEVAFHAVAQRHERIWIFLSMLFLSLLLIATLFIVVTHYGTVVKTPSFEKAGQSGAVKPFTTGNIVKTGPNTYVVHMVGRVWHWDPGTIHLPKGAKVTFYVTSDDVLHGFEIKGTTVNVTAVPGMVGKVTYTFDHPGVFEIVCNEFCGVGHQAMIGHIIVDAEKRT